MTTTHHSHDILTKHLTRACPDGVLDVIGIPAANVIRALPTELDELIVLQRFTDYVLELEDGSILHLEFQKAKEYELYRFLGYDVVLAEHFRRKIRTIVIYTGDVATAPDQLNIGTAIYTVENVFLNRMSGDEALKTVQLHLESDQWAMRDRIRLAFAFRMHFENLSQEEAFELVLSLIKKIPDPDEQDYVTALILGFHGHDLSDRQVLKMREELHMNNVMRRFFKDALEEGRKEGLQKGERKKALLVAQNLFRKGFSLADVVDITGLSEQEAEHVRDKLNL